MQCLSNVFLVICTSFHPDHQVVKLFHPLSLPPNFKPRAGHGDDVFEDVII
jgi:hypothetical protein